MVTFMVATVLKVWLKHIIIYIFIPLIFSLCHPKCEEMALHCLTSIKQQTKWECSLGDQNLSLEDFICKGFWVIMEKQMNNKMYQISKIVLLFYDLQLLCCYYCLVMFLNSSIRNNWPNFLLVLRRYHMASRLCGL